MDYDNKPSYYAIIPANVRYDKELSANAKLLYGEITALCNDRGYCWATNQYFSNLYGVSERTIRTLVKQLVDKKYIKIEIIKNSKRLLYIDYTTPEKKFHPGRKKISYPLEENFLHNNKKNNKKEYNDEIIGEDILNYEWFDR